jgi:predicted Zn-dependent peptidase
MSPHRVTRLRNGLTIASVEMPHMASVSLGLWVGVGARYEPAELNGVCHFIEHLLFKGTERRSPKAISQAVEGIGGYLNAWTSEENTCFYSRARHDRLEELLDVLVDMFLHSRFSPADLTKEREVIKEELAMYRDQPAQHVQELLNATLWPRQPLGRSITGTRRSLDALNRAAILRFMREHYVSGAVVIAAAGNLRHAQLVKAVKRFARAFPMGPHPRHEPVRIRQRQPQVRLHTKKTEQTQLALGVRTCPRGDERRFALRLLNVMLGENMSSRLFQEVREDRGLAYSIYSTISFFHDTGDLVISAGLDDENLPRVLQLTLREMGRLRAALPSLAEFRRARDYVIGQMDLSLESTESRMMWLGEQLVGFGRVFDPAEIRERLAQVTPAQVRAGAQDFFQPDRLNLALVSPLRSPSPLRPILDSFASMGRIRRWPPPAA